MWQYIIVAIIVGWAVYYIWKTFARKKGCACSSQTCTAARPQNAGHTKGHPGCCSGQSSLNRMTKETPRVHPSKPKGQS